MTNEGQGTDGPEEVSDLPEGVEDDLRKKYAQLVTCNAGQFGAFAFKKATQGVYERLVNQMSNENTPAQAMRQFATNCLVYPVDGNGKPDYDVLRALFEAHPELAQEVAEAVRTLPGKIDLKKR